MAGSASQVDSAVDVHAGLEALRATLDMAPVGIAHFDLDGHFLYANDRLCAILGYQRDELLRHTFQEITYADDLPACVALTSQLAAGAIPRYAHEKRFVDRMGHPVWARVTVSAARGSAGDLLFFIGIAEDISEQRAADEARRQAEVERERLLEQERAARAAAEEAIKSRDNVLAVVAHDLRNPVHTIVMSSSLLRELSLTPEERERQLVVINRSAKGMDRLIQDLLDVGRIELGTLEIQHGPVHLEALVNQVMETFEQQSQTRGVRLVPEVGDRLPIVSGDHDRLAQVLSNLVGNALKFTPKGGEVRVRCEQRDQMIAFAVTDTGSGMSPDQLARIFDRFWRANKASRLGVGLGLSIAKGIVDAHGGAIWGESRLGVGTTLHFTLPASGG